MKTYTHDQFEQLATALRGLQSAVALEIIQCLVRDGRANYDALAKEIGTNRLSIELASDPLLRYTILLQEGEELLLHPNMSNEVQSIILALWPDWFTAPSANPE